MALSAASPFYRGHVSDIDCRWGVISASVDDRTREERGLEVRAAVKNYVELYTCTIQVSAVNCMPRLFFPFVKFL